MGVQEQVLAEPSNSKVPGRMRSPKHRALVVCFLIAYIAFVVLDPRSAGAGLGLWIVAPFVAIYLLGNAIWRRIRDARATDWPAVQTAFEFGFVDVDKSRTGECGSAMIGYYYHVNGRCYAGYYRYSTIFMDPGQAERAINRAKGKTITIRYKPDNPSVSRLILAENPDLKVDVAA
jgi:hypothetical protein